MITRDSRSLGSKGVAKVSAKMVNPETFRTDLKAVKRNSKNVSSKIHFSTMQKYKDII